MGLQMKVSYLAQMLLLVLRPSTGVLLAPPPPGRTSLVPSRMAMMPWIAVES